MKKNITVIAGDGIGPEVTRQGIAVLEAIAKKYEHDFQYKHCLMGGVAIEETGNPLPDDTITACLAGDAVLLGAIGHPKYDNDPTAKVRPEQGLLKLRKALELFINIRPVTMYPSISHLSPLKDSRLKDVDFIIYRELTGGIYFGKKETSGDGNSATDECTYSVDEILRIARPAFAEAQKRRGKLTLVDKANVLETSRLWRKVVRELSVIHPDVTVDYMYVDNAAMQVILNPSQFDVILTENMFGDIISDEASVLCGSLGMLPSASIGSKVPLFEPIHGSYPQAAGKNIANPMGTILSIAMMLEHFGMREEANDVKQAVQAALEQGVTTQDINATHGYTTTQVGTFICERILDVVAQEADNYEEQVQETYTYNIDLGQSTII
ncbi:MAG: 3-isopropylmalate dehydrogenase [Flavipsychrobacter sp.]|nr:3-isopropylmalate dehydrogenase [Flavipsychrobacter sp.]